MGDLAEILDAFAIARKELDRYAGAACTGDGAQNRGEAERDCRAMLDLTDRADQRSGSMQGIAVDGTSVYWTNNANGTVMKVPIGGGSPTVLASGQNAPLGSIAVDGTSVYWTTNNGNDTVMKVAK